MKRFLCFAAAVFCLLGFTGCSLFYHSGATIDGIYDACYSTHYKNAFIAHCIWSGHKDEMEFTVPDSCEGYPITMLGGYMGRGYPMPFCVEVPRLEELPDVSEWEGILPDTVENKEDDALVPLVFTVRLGKNITKVNYVHGKGCMYTYVPSSDGSYTDHIAVARIVYKFEVADDNPVFYADNGKLYYKSSGECVDEFYYE